MSAAKNSFIASSIPSCIYVPAISATLCEPVTVLPSEPFTPVFTSTDESFELETVVFRKELFA